VIPIDELTPEQAAALELYLMVEAENDYKPMSYPQISNALAAKKMIVSKSTIGRWALEFDFKSRLDDHINALVTANEQYRKELSAAAGEENVKKTLMTMEENAELLHKSHDLLNKVLDGISEKHTRKQFVSLDDAKLVLSIYKETAGREDRLHDRQAALRSAELIGKADLLKNFTEVELDLEDPYLEAELQDDELEIDD